MGTPSVKLEVSTNLAGLQSSMSSATATVQASADKMAASGKQAQVAWESAAQASVAYAQQQANVKALTDQVSKAIVGETVTAREQQQAIQMLGAAKQRAAAAAAELAAASKAASAGVQEASKAASAGVQEETRSMSEARGAARLLGEETGIRLNRHLSNVLATSSTLGPILNKAFPVIAALGFIEVLSVIPEHFQKAIDAMSGWNEAARKSFESQIAANNTYLESLDKQRIKRAEIDALGTAGQAKIAADQKVTNTELDAEIAKRQRLVSEATNLQRILASRKSPDTEGPPELNPLSESGVGFTAPPMRLDLPSQFTSDKEAQARADELTRLIAEADAKAAQLRLATGLGSAKQSSVEEATEARAQTAAQLQATKTVADAKADAAKHTAELQFETGKITLAQEIQAFRDAISQKLAAESAFLEGRKRLALQHQTDTSANGVMGYQAGPEIARLNADETAARIRARAEQQALDAKLFQDQYEAQKQVFENQIAAAKPASQQRAQLEQQLSEYVRSVWGADSKQYREIVRQRIEAEREWAEQQKRLMQEATRSTDEYLRKSKELTVQGELDKALGQVKTQEVAVKGQAQMGRISPTTELRQEADLHQQEVALEISANQAKLQAVSEFIQKKRAMLADLGGLDSQDPEARKLVQEMQQGNLQIQQLMNQRVQIEQKGSQTAMQDELNILKQREQHWKDYANDISRDLTTGLNSWIQGQKTFSQAMAGMWNSLVMDTVKALEKIAAEWIAKHVIMAAVSKVFHLQDAAQAQAASLAKSAAALQSAAASLSALAAVSAATDAAAANQIASETAADVTTAVEGGATREAEVQGLAALGAAAAFASTCAIPVVGPELAPMAATGALAAIEGFGAMAAFDLGGVVPKTQVALVHGGERVLTESQNSMFERAIAQGGGGGHTFSNTFHVSGVGDPETVARRASDMAVASMKASFRSNGVARR